MDSNKEYLSADEIGPVLDSDLCFTYKGFNCELCSCNSIKSTEQMLGLTKENFRERFPHGVFSDRYVCFIYGHKDVDGHMKEDYDNPDDWCPQAYLVPEAWLYGAEYDLEPGKPVNKYMLDKIDKFLEEHPEI